MSEGKDVDLGDLSASLVRAPRPQDGGTAAARVAELWAEVAGQAVLAHTAARLRGGELVVSVDLPIWATELSALSASTSSGNERTTRTGTGKLDPLHCVQEGRGEAASRSLERQGREEAERIAWSPSADRDGAGTGRGLGLRDRGRRAAGGGPSGHREGPRVEAGPHPGHRPLGATNRAPERFGNLPNASGCGRMGRVTTRCRGSRGAVFSPNHLDKTKERAWPRSRTRTPAKTSRFSKASRPSASGRACTSGPPAPRACTTSSTRSSTTPSTRRSPATAPPSRS